MKFKDTFSYSQEDPPKPHNDYDLIPYEEYETKLEPEFYLQVFIRKFLFGIDILEIKDFLEHHYDYCDDPEKYYQVLEYKIIPKIKEIKENGEVDMAWGGYIDEIELKDGFVETEGVIKNWSFDYRLMKHQVGLHSLHFNIEKKIEIAMSFIKDYKETSQLKPLKWIAGPSQLAIIIRELIDKEYMTADFARGEINNSKLARELFKTYKIKDCESPKGIEIYLSPNNKRYQGTKKKFDDAGLNIPHAKFT